MTAVAPPFVFTSDVFQDRFVTLAAQAGCGALALQLGVAPSDAHHKTRAAGLQVIGWGSCTPLTGDELRSMSPNVWMPQAESTAEFDALIAALDTGLAGEFPCEPVMTSGGMETEKPGATDAEKEAERTRRRNLLQSYGVTTVWVEVYKQDADRSGQAQLGDVEFMCAFFQSAFGFVEAHPVVGLWDNVPLSAYDLSRRGRVFGAWRAEQMEDARYAEIAALIPDDLEDLMEKIGTQHGIDGFMAWLRSQPGVPGDGPGFKADDVNTWRWPRKVERTLRLLKDDHDTRAQEG